MTHRAEQIPTRDRLADMTIAVLGGTGPQGRGLARRFAACGPERRHRQPQRGPGAAQRRPRSPRRSAATSPAPTTPERPRAGRHRRGRRTVGRPQGAAGRRWPPSSAGKVVVDCVNPLGFDKQGAYALAGRGGLRRPAGRRRCSPTAPSSAPSTTSAPCCSRTRRSSRSTPTYSCSATSARPPTWSRRSPTVIPGVRGVYGGRLRNAHQVEALTANLISVNRRYKAHSGLRVTDI